MKLALFGAGGKMGMRLSANLGKSGSPPGYAGEAPKV